MRDGSLTYYKKLYDSMEILPGKEEEVREKAKILCHFQEKYKKVADGLDFPFPFLIVGLIHMMESNFDFQRGLHNGEPWFRETTMVPKGRGPFESWEDSAIDVLEMKKSIMPSVWDVASGAMFLEKYNGGGYMRRNVHSPYLWSFSNYGVDVGKYTEDRHYDPDAVSQQAGAMVVLNYYEKNYSEIEMEEKDSPPFLQYNPKEFDPNVRSLQIFINSLLDFSEKEILKPDGKAGPKTSDMCKGVFGYRLHGDPRGVR